MDFNKVKKNVMYRDVPVRRRTIDPIAHNPPFPLGTFPSVRLNVSPLSFVRIIIATCTFLFMLSKLCITAIESSPLHWIGIFCVGRCRNDTNICISRPECLVDALYVRSLLAWRSDEVRSVGGIVLKSIC